MFGRRLHTARMVNKQHYKGNHAIIDLESEKSYIRDQQTKNNTTYRVTKSTVPEDGEPKF